MILVAGAGGLVGRAAVEVLQSGRRPWIELSRSARGGAAEDGSRSAVSCDVTDAAALARAAPSVRSIVHLAGVAPGRRPARADHEVAAMQALLALARERECDRFVFLSASGADPSSSHPWLRAKGEAERLLRASGVPFVVLRAGLVASAESPLLHAVMQLVRAGVPLRLPLLRAGRVLPIAAGDVAIALATSLDHPRMLGQIVDLGVPPALTLHELLHLVAARLREPLVLRRLPFRGHAIAAALERVPIAPLTDGAGFVRLFALLEPPAVDDYDRWIPMRRAAFVDELRGFPWGAPPPRPGDPLPTAQPPPAPALPWIIPGAGRETAAGSAPGGKADSARGADLSRFGRTDPYGRVVDGERTPHEDEP